LIDNLRVRLTHGIAFFVGNDKMFGKSTLYSISHSLKITLKLLSQPWWVLLPKIKTNQNKQQYFTDTHYQ